MRSTASVLLLASILAGAGCASRHPNNPSFPLTRADAKAALKAMARDPKPLARPLVIVSGFHDPEAGAWWVSLKVDRFAEDERIVTVGYAISKDIHAARAEVIREVNEAFPSDDPNWTVPVDVIGISMGGLVSRYAALPPQDGSPSPRLKIVRLFTLSSPHRGAVMADKLKLPDKQMLAMLTDSPFITWLNETDTKRDYELVPYVRLGDGIIGPENAAPVGMTPWWQPNKPLEHAHIAGTLDVRFMADIARRLRGEAPFVMSPPAALPTEADEPDPTGKP